MRTKTRARARPSRSSHRLSSTTTARRLPPPSPDNISNGDDSADRSDCDETNVSVKKTCLKCNGGDQLLFCSRIGCQIALHDKCIPSKPEYDEEGNFCCPYCWYKLQQSRTKELKYEVTLARKALEDFLDSKACNDKEKEHDGNVRQDMGKNDQCEVHNEEEEEQMHKDAGGDAALNAPEISDSDSDTETIAVRLKQRNSEKGQNANSLEKSSIHLHSDSTPVSRNQNREVNPSKFTKLSFAFEKRKRLHWTPEEEDALREGVHKYSATVNKNIPWRKILVFGCHVFDHSRTPADLKDKWRNILAKESSATNSRPT